MIAALDVHYRAAEAVVGCVLFEAWTDATPAEERRLPHPIATPYAPGAFYLRELPPLQAMLAEIAPAPTIVIVDGYVWLAPGRPGLGKRLHTALDGAAAVVGVAKSAFAGAAARAADAEAVVRPVLRGRSRRPLFVSAEGIALDVAAEAVARMHGADRTPTLLRRADALSRGAA